MGTKRVAATATLVLTMLGPVAPAQSRAPEGPPRALPPLTAVARDGLTRALGSGRISPARYALERWSSVWHPRAVGSRFGIVRMPRDPHALTFLARDLQVRLGDLHGRARRRAQSLLARPTDGNADPEGDGYNVGEETPRCDPNVCVHYVTTSPDKVPPTDDDGDSVPDYVESALAVMKKVWAREVGKMGFRVPKSDLSSDNNGGNHKLDVYLVALGSGYYGYCQTDDPHLAQGSSYAYGDGSAYCVLDNDYAGFGYPDPIDPMRVTAAHEFFHAVQFAYDYFEDRWFMEGTAAWMEDEIYDAIDDNLQYFSASPLQDPTVPLDKDVGLRIYGTWIFWRFLSEYFGSASSHDASVIRAVWNKADYSPNGPDQYSAQAVATVVNARSIGGKRWHFSWAFADFAAWNAAPSRFYEEGRANGYPKAAISKTAAITGSNRRVTAASSLDHLSNRYVAVNRGRGVHADATLKVVLNGPASATSPEASVVVIKKSGAASFKGVSLNADGDGSVVVNFGDTVARVVVITTNASVRFTKCYRRLTPYSCLGGVPVDDDRSYSFRATLVQ